MPATMIPSLRYQDAPAAIDWLARAFAFEAGLVVPDGEGGIAHAQLVMRDAKRGDAMVMLGSVRPGSEFGRWVLQPGECGGRSTQCPYIVVDAIDEHYERACAAGAEIVMPIADQDYGGRVYTCRDPEGHLWCFGSYDPWAESS
ncbi:VOC family protein [Pelomonas sp. KK5]|uniref:VOC family protein n=1 Tax=Pelomonas sp. KK5 TaxID=1855730 RepID=UPI00097C33DA|nr:VOC family protein [Pelomonas sp. KK5]